MPAVLLATGALLGVTFVSDQVNQLCLARPRPLFPLLRLLGSKGAGGKGLDVHRVWRGTFSPGSHLCGIRSRAPLSD